MRTSRAKLLAKIVSADTRALLRDRPPLTRKSLAHSTCGPSFGTLAHGPVAFRNLKASFYVRAFRALRKRLAFTSRQRMGPLDRCSRGWALPGSLSDCVLNFNSSNGVTFEEGATGLGPSPYPLRIFWNGCALLPSGERRTPLPI